VLKDKMKWDPVQHSGRLQNMTYTPYLKEDGLEVRLKLDQRNKKVTGYDL
jgi:hypothetical protein